MIQDNESSWCHRLGYQIDVRSDLHGFYALLTSYSMCNVRANGGTERKEMHMRRRRNQLVTLVTVNPIIFVD